jgi:hypothetical protein
MQEIAVPASGGAKASDSDADSRAAFAPRDAQQAAVVHDVEQLRARVRRTPEPVGHFAMREVRIHLARMHGAASANERQHGRCLLGARGGPYRARRSWVHQAVMRPRQISIVDEKIFLHGQLWIAPFEVADAIARHPVAQRQVLCPGRGTDRICLHESQLLNRTPESRGLEQRACDGITAQMIQRDRHAAMIFQSSRCAWPPRGPEGFESM